MMTLLFLLLTAVCGIVFNLTKHEGGEKISLWKSQLNEWSGNMALVFFVIVLYLIVFGEK